MIAFKVLAAMWMLAILLGAARLSRKFVPQDDDHEDSDERHREFLSRMGCCPWCRKPYYECEGCE